MELRFSDPRLQLIAESTVKSNARFGMVDGPLVRQRLCELAAADNLAIAASVPILDFKQLPSPTTGFELWLRPRLRLVFDIADPVLRSVGNGEVDLAQVEAIRILRIEECDEP